MPDITLNGRWIEADLTYKERHVAKEIMGYRWKDSKKVWQYPKSPATAHELQRRFSTDRCSSDVKRLAQQYERRKDAWAIRDKVYKNEGDPEELDRPEIYRTNLWAHQKLAYRFALKLKSCYLAMAMGTGKTKVAIDLIQNRGHKNVFVFCPKSVINVWPAEFEKHHVGNKNADYRITASTHRRVKKRVNKMRQDHEKAQALGIPWIGVTNYEAVLSEPMYEFCKEINEDFVVADEIHNIKAPGGKISMTMYRLFRKTPWKLGLSGTMMPHSPLDIYAQYRFLDPGIFGTSKTLFTNRYAVKGGYEGKEIVDWKHENEMNQKIYSIALKIDKDVLDLPEAVDVNRYTELDKRESETYIEMKDKMMSWLAEQEGVVSAPNALVKLLRLQQITGGFVTNDAGETVFLGESKRNLLASVCEELEGGFPFIVFARFKKDIEAIRDVGSDLGADVKELSGSKRTAISATGSLTETCDIAAVQIQAGKEGIDLSRASVAIYYSLGFSLGDYKQSRARLVRPGQTESVKFIHLMAKGTIDERVMKAMERKQDVIDYILDDIREAMGHEQSYA